MKKKNTFIHAASGISHVFRNEANFRIHVAAMALATVFGVALQISAVEWLLVAGCCMLVLSLELVNTAIENVCDLVSKDFHPVIKIIKDVSAAAVLVSAVGSTIAGGIIFIPKFIHQLKYFLC